MNNIAIAAGHKVTADTALDVLKSGGNAIDAAIAAFLVSWIAEPCMSSAGGGAFASVYTKTGNALVFDFFAQTPLSKKLARAVDFYAIEVDFGGTKEQFQIGKGTTAVPGSIAGIYEMHKHFGSIPMKELLQPAIIAAKEGVAVDKFQAYDLQLLQAIFEVDPEGRKHFVKNDKLIKEGDILKLPKLSSFLEYLSYEGPNAFYKGEIAQKIEDAYAAGGGYLTKADLAAYQVAVRKPMQFKYKDKTIFTNPFPSVGGATIALLLAFMGETPDYQNPLGEAHINQVLKAYQQLRAIGSQPKNLAKALQSAYNFTEKPTLSKSNKRGNTSHMSIVDKWGNGVSLTMTIGEGAGYFLEGTNINMNNMLGEGALLPNGFHSWTPNVRLSSMMAPTLVLDDRNRLEMLIGTGGASRIPSAIMQVLHNSFGYGLPLKTAVENARIHLEHGDLNIEHGFEAIPNDLEHAVGVEKVSIWDEKSMFFGGTHVVQRQNGKYLAVGDDRRCGVVAGD